MTVRMIGELEILLVGPNPKEVDLIRSFLKGTEVPPVHLVWCPSQESAVEELTLNKYHLILLDLDHNPNLPNIAVKKIKSVANRVPILALTSRREQDQQKGSTSGAEEYLVKEDCHASHLWNTLKKYVPALSASKELSATSR